MNDKNVKVILVIVLGFGVLSIIFNIKGLWHAAVAIGVVSLLIPIVGNFIVQAWESLAKVLGYINSRILLSIIFFFILTPLAFLNRLFSKSSFQATEKGASAYKERNHLYAKEDFDNPW